MASTYDVLDLVRLSATFTDTGGTGVAPTGLRFLVKDPADTVTVYTTGSAVVVAASTYQFTCDITVGSGGTWRYRVETDTGTGQAADESWFRVLPQRVSTST